MSLRAKVNSSCVESLKSSAEEVIAVTEKTSSAVTCLEKMISEGRSDISRLEETIPKAVQTLDRIDEKERRIERIIEELDAEISDLEEEISDKESELDDIPEYITYEIVHPGDPETGEGGYVETVTESNPVYVALENEIYWLNSRKDQLENKRYSEISRLEHLRDVKANLTDTLDEMKSSVDRLEACCSRCMEYINELQDISSKNQSYGREAIEKLRKVLDVIKSYISKKVDYSDIQLTSKMSEENIAEFAPQYIATIAEPVVIKPTMQEIKEHGIRFDANERISLYDGKTFGGNYVTYEKRMEKVPKNLIFGAFEGVVGESKFIPIERTAKGISAKRELDKFGCDGIVYRNGEPDFEVCAYAVVKISNMCADRESNFTEADIVCSELWNTEKRDGRNDWTPREVSDYRAIEKLSWHEKCDTETMVLVKSIINDYFRHSGGVAECKARDGVKDSEDEYDE